MIARRVRESGVYCEIVPFNKVDEIWLLCAKGVILSGIRPASAANSPAPQYVFEAGLPVLGICYGQQTMTLQLGGKVEGDERTGRASIEGSRTRRCLMARRQGRHRACWMSHGDRVVAIAPGFKVVAQSRVPSPSSPMKSAASMASSSTGVVHTPRGRDMLWNFTHRICGCKATDRWSLAKPKSRKCAQVGKGR